MGAMKEYAMEIADNKIGAAAAVLGIEKDCLIDAVYELFEDGDMDFLSAANKVSEIAIASEGLTCLVEVFEDLENVSVNLEALTIETPKDSRSYKYDSKSELVCVIIKMLLRWRGSDN